MQKWVYFWMNTHLSKWKIKPNNYNKKCLFQSAPLTWFKMPCGILICTWHLSNFFNSMTFISDWSKQKKTHTTVFLFHHHFLYSLMLHLESCGSKNTLLMLRQALSCFEFYWIRKHSRVVFTLAYQLTDQWWLGPISLQALMSLQIGCQFKVALETLSVCEFMMFL